MEKKKVKDTTKEDHYVEIAVGVKIIYNQNQYLAYTEVPKKKKDIRLEIYIGRVSLLKDQYLLFKCETDSERRQVFSYFKQVFSGEENSEIELIDFSVIDRMSIVSSDLFEEKMDQYPNFFTLPEKEEEISANITLPSFLMKKTSKIKDEPEEIQFVGNSSEVLESNIEMPVVPTETITQDENTKEQVPSSTVEVTEALNPPIVSTEPVVQTPTKVQPTVTQTITNTATTQTPIVNPTPVSVSTEPIVGQPLIEPTIIPNIEQSETINQVPPVMKIDPSVREMAPLKENATVVEVPEPTLDVVSEEPVKFEQIYDSKKKKGRTSIIILMIITLLLIASIAIVYIFFIEPKIKEENKPNTPPVVKPEEPKTSDLVCTIEVENEEDDSLEQKNITFVYDNTTKNILSSKEHLTVTMHDAEMYNERKAMIKIFSQELNQTEGQKYKFQYDDKKYIYQVFIDRDYEKATEAEKDETWKSTFEEANEYYLQEGYTCNGIKKEPSNEKELESITGNNTVDYNNWVVTYQKAVFKDDKETLSITLEVTNNASETRTLNGSLKLFDEGNKNIRNMKLTQQIIANETSTIVVDLKSTNENKDPELGSLETIDFENAIQYLIELYR